MMTQWKQAMQTEMENVREEYTAETQRLHRQLQHITNGVVVQEQAHAHTHQHTVAGYQSKNIGPAAAGGGRGGLGEDEY